MLKKENNTNIQINENSVTFLCHGCKNIGKVFVENWNENSDGPFCLEIIDHINSIAVVNEVINLKKSNKQPIKKYAYCNNCKTLLYQPVNTKYLIEHSKIATILKDK